jgi:RHS repeat-associated protein
MAGGASLRALLDRSIDYAGMFPPCSLALEPALENQARYVRSADAWMLTFEYDASDLKTKMTYPNGTDYQSWTYDPAKNLIARRTVNNVSQLFSYDSRNRQFAMAWSDGADWANFGYDDASRMISAENPTSTITRGYDPAGRLTLDRQRLRILPLTAVSRKTHNTYPTPMPFDIALPLVGTAGIECRTGGATNDHEMVVTFPRAVTFTGASFTSGTGTVASTSTSTDGKMVTINLTGVTNAQTITVTLAGVNDGITTNDVNIGMGVLWGDTTGNGFVNSADVSQVQSQSGQSVSNSNFREDVTANGFINSGDVGVVQWQSGHSLPSAPPLTQPLPSSPDIDVQYAYDDDGKEKQVYVTSAGYNLNYDYDGQGRFDQIQNAGGTPLFTYTYDAASNEVDRLNNTTGVHQSYGAPDQLNRMTLRDVKLSNQTVISHEAYGYDSQRPGLLTSVTRQEQNQTQNQDFFSYDLTGELTNAQYAVPSGGSAARSCDYIWDKAGNRTRLTDSVAGTYNYGVNNLNQYTSDGTSGGAITPGPNHELLNYQNVNYTYINDTHLSSISGMDINGQQSTYQLSYDALGRCVARVLTNPSGSMTTYYIYDGEKPVLEYQSSYLLWTAPSAANIYGRGIDEILQRTDYAAGRTLYYQDDHEGSITHLTDQSGNIVEWYRYDAFGAPTFFNAASQQIGGTNWDNRFLFTGREYVLTFSIYEYRNRAYHPGLGRFMSEDPKLFVRRGGLDKAPDDWSFSKHLDEAEYNLFRYCGNDPLDFSDPMGYGIEYDPTTPPEFQQAARAWVERVRQADSATVTQLEASKHEHFITQPTHPNEGTGSTSAINSADAKNGKGSGTIIKLDPSKAPPSKDLKGNTVKTPGSVVTGHEFGHAADIDKGRDVPPPSRQEQSKMSEKDYLNHPSERNAVEVENRARELEKLQFRFKPPTDKAGTSPGQ